MSVLWLAGLSFAVVMLFTHGIKLNKTEWVIVIAAWIVRVLYATLNNIGVIEFRGDAFFEMAWGLYYGYNHVIDGTYPVITNYPPVLLGEFRVFGINRIVTCYVNAFLTMIALFYMLKCFRLLKINKRIACMLLFTLAFNPFAILWGSDIYREAVYLPLTSLSLYCFIKWSYRKSPCELVFATASVLPAAWLHTGYFFIVAGYAFVSLLDFKRITARRLINKAILLGGVVVVCGITLFTQFADKLAYRFSTIKDLVIFSSNFNAIQTMTNIGSGSQYLKWMQGPTTFLNLLIKTPLRMFYFLYSPMAWDCYRLKDVVAFVTDSVVFLAALVLVVEFLINKKWKQEKYKKASFLIIAIAFVIIITVIPFAWGTYNAGTALRHRNCLLPFICTQIGICLTVKKKRYAEEA